MDINLINIIVAIGILILGYFFGSIPTAIIIGKVFFHQDPRNFGSKNAGGTNAGRLWGKRVGFIVIFIDMLKTILPIWIAWAILTYVNFGDKPLMADTATRLAGLDSTYSIRWSMYWLAPLGTVIGHCYPIFAKFRGGKGVSNFMGICVCTSWLLGFLVALFSFFGILKAKKYVSLASILTAFIVSAFYWLWAILTLCGVTKGIEILPGYGFTILIDWVAALSVTVMAVMILLRHIPNIQLLKNHTERKITWLK